MSSGDNKDSIKITLEDLAAVSVPETPSAPVATNAAGMRSYGTVAEAAEHAAPVLPEERGSILLQGWFYLGLAGLLGALAGWAIAEPGFVDGGHNSWG